MAFGDFLKKVQDVGAGIVSGAVEMGKQLAAEQAKARKEREMLIKQQEEAAKEVERKQREEQKAKELEQILKPACEKGDCCWNEHRFYFNCGNAECERKKSTKGSWGKLKHPEYWQYLKRFEEFEKLHMRPDKIIVEELAEDWLKEFAPKLLPFSKIVYDNICIHGVADNEFLNILHDINDFPVDGGELGALSIGIAGKNTFTDSSLNPCRTLAQTIDEDSIEMQLEHDFYREKSLYGRSGFIFTIKAFEFALNPKRLAEYIGDTSHISIDQLFDSEGNIKSAGEGGPEAGFYGDTIWNTVASWGKN